ncbi:hypothetical protein Rleg4DRAFT_4792 [Rhizobium leguminosarum bv. trifolii WSM2297]|uniref:Uncharacterized protein n=1 Tax=Rhizobium leguminosarum bv. trifolii WSM2297 TaxID=754762 RepID=J0KYZ4_RHILT|nr:hypothetical protein [Rhizobium leguminosarum]EJC83054.1 hypothetical protein Rleg4DRAFT_4792 [Rhizobium leguminosarum bv. trifolii WSM2297]
MAVVVGTELRRGGGKRPAGSIMSQFAHAAGICTITSSFAFLFALVIGLIR